METREYFEKVMQDYNQNRKGRSLRKYALPHHQQSLLHVGLCPWHPTLSLIAFFALYLGESIMFPTIFSLALRDAGTKTKLASSLLIMTIVGGAVAPVIMGYIADTTGSMAIAFLIPLVCYGVIGTYALSNRHVSF